MEEKLEKINLKNKWHGVLDIMEIIYYLVFDSGKRINLTKEI